MPVKLFMYLKIQGNIEGGYWLLFYTWLNLDLYNNC